MRCFTSTRSRSTTGRPLPCSCSSGTHTFCHHHCGDDPRNLRVKSPIHEFVSRVESPIPLHRGAWRGTWPNPSRSNPARDTRGGNACSPVRHNGGCTMSPPPAAPRHTRAHPPRAPGTAPGNSPPGHRPRQERRVFKSRAAAHRSPPERSGPKQRSRCAAGTLSSTWAVRRRALPLCRCLDTHPWCSGVVTLQGDTKVHGGGTSLPVFVSSFSAPRISAGHRRRRVSLPSRLRAPVPPSRSRPAGCSREDTRLLRRSLRPPHPSGLTSRLTPVPNSRTTTCPPRMWW